MAEPTAYNKEAEQAVLGSAIINPSIIPELGLIPRHFYNHRHGMIWEAMQRLEDEGAPIDFMTVEDELSRMGKLDTIGGSSYLASLTNVPPSSLHGERYARTVKEYFARRQMMRVASELARQAQDETIAVPDTLVNIARALDDVHVLQEKTKSVGDITKGVFDDVMARIEQQKEGDEIRLGFRSGIGYFDRAFRDLKQGWLVFIAGPPNVGKSRLALQVAQVFAHQGRGDYISLEMDEEAMAYRLYSMQTGVDDTDIEYGKVKPELMVKALERLGDLEFGVYCPPSLTLADLKSYIATRKRQAGIQWVVVDYVSLITTPQARSEVEEDELISGELRRISSQYEVLIIALDSVTKTGASGMMTLADVRGSFTKMHDADIALGMSAYDNDRASRIGYPVLARDQKRMSRLVGVMKDRHRGQKGKVFALELNNGLIDDLGEDRFKYGIS